MANMSYCRFQNTANDLDDCYEHIDDDLGADEAHARERLIDLCRQIAEWADATDDWGDEEDES